MEIFATRVLGFGIIHDLTCRPRSSLRRANPPIAFCEGQCDRAVSPPTTGAVYIILHFFFVLSLLKPLRTAALVAAVKTSLTPSCVRAEHSRYAVAPIFLRISSPCNRLIDDRYTKRVGKANLWLCDPLWSLSDLIYLGTNFFLRFRAYILLAADKNDRKTLTEVQDLRNPLLRRVSVFDFPRDGLQNLG